MDLLDRLLDHDLWTTRQLMLECRPLGDARLCQRPVRPSAIRRGQAWYQEYGRFFILHPSAFILLLLALACASTPALPPSPAPAQATSPGDNPTAGAIRRSTQQARLQAAASQTAQVAANATQAAEVQASTRQAANTAVAARATSQAVLAAKAAWPRRVLESFSDNQLGWPVGLTQDHSLAVTSTVAGERYQWRVDVAHGNSYFNLLPDKGPTFADFYGGVTVQFGEGNDDSQSAYGLAFRHVKDDYGFFGVLKSGGFRILEVHHTGIYQLIQSDSSAFNTHPGSSNRIAVAAIGPDFVFLINDQVVGQLAADLTPGKIGLGVDALTSASEARVDFSDFEINAP